MKRKILRVAAELMPELFRRDDLATPRQFITMKGMPDDARVIGAQFNYERSDVELIIESDTFEDVKPGCYLERMSIDVSYCTHTEPIAIDFAVDPPVLVREAR